MVIEELCKLYDRIIGEGYEIAPPGYSAVNVSHVLRIDEEGNLKAIDTLDKENKRQRLILPQSVIRSRQISSNLLYDNTSYILGLDRNKTIKELNFIVCEDKYSAFKIKNQSFLKDIDTPVAKAIYRFLDNWFPSDGLEDEIIIEKMNELAKSSNLIFKLDSEDEFAHDNQLIKEKYEKLLLKENKNKITGQCLVTGKETELERLHMPIKSIYKAQSSGALLVSFNIDSACSYGKEQGFNAPVSKDVAFKYTTALNYLSNSVSNKLQVGDMSLFVWADKYGGSLTEKLVMWNFDKTEEEDTEEADSSKKSTVSTKKIDIDTARKAREIFKRVRNGLPLSDISIPEDSKIYILGIMPNKSRLSIRYWETTSFEAFAQKIAKHYEDIYITGLNNEGFITPFQILISIEPMSNKEKIKYQRELLNAILNVVPYAPILYQSAIRMCHNMGEYGGVNPIRVALIKGYLKRKYRFDKDFKKEEMITVSLNKNCDEIGYLLGRLFCILERIQIVSSMNDYGKSTLNKTIVDNYVRSASVNPQNVFPYLLKLSEAHMSKMGKRKPGLAIYFDKIRAEIIGRITSFPFLLDVEQQGLFMLGYYHQREELFSSRKSEEVDNNVNIETEEN